MTARQELRENYWRVIRRTRKSGRVSRNVVEKEEEYWSRFPDDVVDEALRIHISRYPDYRECYTRGIMRNIHRERQKGAAPAAGNAFNRFPQRDYDFGALEKQLVHNMQEG